jgi:hypothetical protein
MRDLVGHGRYHGLFLSLWRYGIDVMGAGIRSMRKKIYKDFYSLEAL